MLALGCACLPDLCVSRPPRRAPSPTPRPRPAPFSKAARGNIVAEMLSPEHRIAAGLHAGRTYQSHCHDDLHHLALPRGLARRRRHRRPFDFGTIVVTLVSW